MKNINNQQLYKNRLGRFLLTIINKIVLTVNLYLSKCQCNGKCPQR